MAYNPLSITAGTGISLIPSPISNKGGSVSLDSTILTAPFILQTATASLTGAQSLGALTTGLLKNTATTGVLSTATAGTDYAAANILGGLAISGTTISSTAANVSITITPNGTGAINLSKIAVFSQGQRVAVTSITANYTVLTTDYIVSVGIISSPITITLPASPLSGQFYIIKDRAGGANANNITIKGAVAGDTIDGISGTTGIVISQAYGTVSLYCNNVNTWSIL